MEEWQKPETITLWVAIGIILLLLLLVFIILLVRVMFNKMVKTRVAAANEKWKHQEELFESAIETQEVERKRIAEDLHDDLIGKLLVLQMENQINVKHETSLELIAESINIARRISHDLSPPLIEYSSLQELTSDVLEPWSKVMKVSTLFDVRLDINYSDHFKINFIRILQEVVTNIIKHAEASKIDLRFKQTKSSLTIIIKDDGKGFDLSENVKGLGLTNIETRVKYLKGFYKVKSKKDRGTQNLFVFKMI